MTVAGEYDWNLPEGFPLPAVPADNPMSAAKVELGRHLFHDQRLSGNGTQSCASCHQQRLAFSDGLTNGVGSTGDIHPRNSMSLTNAAYYSSFNWANPAIDSLEVQANGPFVGIDPVELGLTGVAQFNVLRSFGDDPLYSELFPAAFPENANPFTFPNVLRAIAAFERTLISGNSSYDRYQRGDHTALSEAARRGMDLFFSERLECFHCHSGLNLGQPITHAGTLTPQREFHNNGLYNIGGTGAYPDGNRGLWEITASPGDMGRFKAPTLRNIALTAPYMHDGSIATLSEVLDHYARGGRLIESGPFAGDGALSPVKSIFVTGFVLAPEEKLDVLAFLDSLTDWEFICDPRHSDPFGNIPPHEHCE